MDQPTNPKEKRSTFAAAAPAIELMCWFVMLLAPALRWVNGAAVTGDQAVVQGAVFVVAVVSAVGLRIINWRNRKKAR